MDSFRWIEGAVAVAILMETAFISGGHPGLAEPRFTPLKSAVSEVAFGLESSARSSTRALPAVGFCICKAKKRVVWWWSSSVGLECPPDIKAGFGVGPIASLSCSRVFGWRPRDLAIRQGSTPCRGSGTRSLTLLYAFALGGF